MSEIKRNLETKVQTIVSAGQSVQSGIQLNANPDFSRVFDTQDNLLVEMLPGERFVCPTAEPTEVIADCVQSEIIPTWAILTHTTGSGGAKTWQTVPGDVYGAGLQDEAFIAILADENGKNARHCKDIEWFVETAATVTGGAQLEFSGANQTDYFQFGGVLFWQPFSTGIVVRATVELDGELFGRAITLEFP
jgi:hypothetical protein